MHSGCVVKMHVCHIVGTRAELQGREMTLGDAGLMDMSAYARRDAVKRSRDSLFRDHLQR